MNWLMVGEIAVSLGELGWAIAKASWGGAAFWLFIFAITPGWSGGGALFVAAC